MPTAPADSNPLFDDVLAALRNVETDPASLPQLTRDRIQILAFHSPTFAQLCAMNPGYLIPWLPEGALEKKWNKKELSQAIDPRMRQSDDPQNILRQFQREHIVRIAWKDLCGLADIQDVTEELSDLADVIVQYVFDLCWNQLERQYGTPASSDARSEANLAVIGLGKLGGRELNFSSDIDLMFVYDFDGSTTGGIKGSVENKVYFTYLAQSICDILTKTTQEGFFYRVDNRLRPEGEKGALAVSLMTVEMYYHTYGQNWERQALLKARPIAGSPNVGKKFLSVITPFTYRKYVDEIEIAEVLRTIDRMREHSLRAIGPEEKQRINFKNGLGGIRDIEFFVQAVQMLYGGQYPEIKMTGTLISLQRMNESGLLQTSEFELLRDAYKFLRKIEHRLQMVYDQQVYELPSDEVSRRRLALSMQASSWDELIQRYDDVTGKVRELYRGVFHRDEWEDKLEAILYNDRFSDEIGDILSLYEFTDPQKAFRFLKELQRSPDLHLQTKTTRLFKAILPRLLQCLKNSPDPDLTITNFEKIVASFRARSALYESMSDQPQFLDLLVSVTSSSSFLTRLVLRDPSLIETIGHDGFLDELITSDLLQRHLDIIGQTYPKSDYRDHLLRVQNAAMFRSGIRFILGITDIEHMGYELTHIADFILEKSMKPAHEKVLEIHPSFSPSNFARIAVLGFGKLAGCEFNVASDCDIVVVYDDSSMDRDVFDREYFPRWVMQYTKYLDSKTTLGFLYKPDTRLRPHGNSGALASSYSSFSDYYQREAHVWEKMALSRSRVVCGNPSAQPFLASLKDKVLFSRPLTHDEIQAIVDMRKKIESEKSDEEALKAGPGGLVDVEFIAQTIVLYFGHSHPAVRLASTFEIIRQACDHRLIDCDDANQLIHSYSFLREVENRLRIVNNVSMDSLPSEPSALEEITRRYALNLNVDKLTPDEFLNQISHHTTQVRSIFNRFFDLLLEQSA